MNLWEMLKASKGLPSDDYMARLFALKTGRNATEDVTVSGVPCVLKNSVGKPVVSYKIYGNTVQNGTPTPENPVEVQSVGELVTDGENSGKYEIPVVCRGKNLFDYRAMFEKSTEGVNEYFREFRLKLKPNTKYTISTNISEYNANTTPFIVTNTSEEIKTVIGGVSSIRPRTVSTANDGILVVSYRIKEPIPTVVSGTVVTIDKFTDYNGWLQIEPGDTATEYEPYREPVKTNILLNEPLHKIGDYADFIDFENGRIVRNISKKVFDGTEEFLPHSSLKGWFQSADSTVLANKPAYCTHFSYINSATSMNAGQFTTANTISDAGRHVFRMSGDTTLEDFKTFLASEYAKGTPVVVYYTLAEPTEEPLILPEIPTFDGTTIIETDTEIQPSDMEITYKSRRKKQ